MDVGDELTKEAPPSAGFFISEEHNVTWIPSKDNVLNIHYELARIFEGQDDPISPIGVKSEAMLDSAVNRPHTGIGDHLKYNSLEQKIAALFHSLTKNHPFHNGNKRTALVSLLTTLHRNDRRLINEVTDDEVYDFVVAVTADEYPTRGHDLDVDSVIKEIAKWIRKRSIPTIVRISNMTPKEFISCVKAMGARTKKTGNFHIVTYGEKSIRFRASAKSLPGPVVRQYLNELKLNGVNVGVSAEEFQEGAQAEERALIYRFMAALQRLAKT